MAERVPGGRIGVVTGVSRRAGIGLLAPSILLLAVASAQLLRNRAPAG